MTRPRKYLIRMFVFVIAITGLCGFLFLPLQGAFMANAPLNGLIVGVLVIGVIYNFRQVLMLYPEVAWIEEFQQNGTPLSEPQPPKLLAPMATMVGDHKDRLSLSTLAMRSLLDGIVSRLDESRDISRYTVGLLIFLGLLGTFWGLLGTVGSIGDVIGGLQFTHVAGYHAGVLLKNALFRWPAKADHRAVPWVTYTDPELAQVGLTEKQAQKAGFEFRILRWPFHENDRALAEAATGGLIKTVVRPTGHILGCGIAGAHAGELIHTWVLAMSRKIKIGAIAQMVVPYPTLGEVSKRTAGSFYTPSLFSERTRKFVRFLGRFG